MNSVFFEEKHGILEYLYPSPSLLFSGERNVSARADDDAPISLSKRDMGTLVQREIM